MPSPRQPGSESPHSAQPLVGADALFAQVRHLEAELDRINGELAQSHRLAALGSLAAVVAHEINNVLTPVTSYAQLALDSPGDLALTRKALEVSVESVGRAERVMASVLGLARDEPEAASSEPQVSALRSAVPSALESLVGTAEADGITVTTQVPDVAVAMPAGDLHRLLVNLLRNARRALLTKPDDRRLSITGRVFSDRRKDGDRRKNHLRDGGGGGDRLAGRFAELWVSDNGPGVPAEVRGRLFEPFVTCAVGGRPPCDRAAAGGEGARKAGAAEPEAGTGLGLSICRELVERAGGVIELTRGSESGGGAVFRVVLAVVG